MWSKFTAVFFCTFLLATKYQIKAEDATEDEGKNESEPSDRSKDGYGEETSSVIGSSVDVRTAFLFTTKSSGNQNELISGHIVKFLIGFSNRGEKDFTVKHCETSFRYPLDFSYHVQNFSAVYYDRLVQPKQEATFDYAFIPSDGFVGRPLGLVVNLHYVDSDGSPFISTVFNETVTIMEDESSYQTETYFLYILMAGFVVLVLFIIQHFLSKFTRKSSPSYQSVYEVGTNKNQVDFEWIPRNHLEQKKSPKMGSPRNRRPLKSAS